MDRVEDEVGEKRFVTALIDLFRASANVVSCSS